MGLDKDFAWLFDRPGFEVALYVTRTVEDGVDDDWGDISLVDDQVRVDGKEEEWEGREIGSAVALAWVCGKGGEFCKELILDAKGDVFSGLFGEVSDYLTQIV